MLSPAIITSNQIELSNFKLNKTGYTITLALMYLTILLPIIISTVILSTGGKPSFGLFISWAVFGFIAYFFYRLATWNKCGKELFILEGDKLIYKPEAKNISYKHWEFKLDNLVVSIADSTDQIEYEGTNQQIAWLKFTDGTQHIQTNIKTPRSVVVELIRIFETWGIKNDLLLNEIKN
ncbi:hypothetical protein [Fluviicola chungangensis]|uniref:Uncharacterized protein n=1 Tax=Fluviicola chungangensis TaxID=2597671 RepID=A0A556MR21_9FLAO|nr:hypothetical protein [Fluviicola chungangensis]TSJ42394.1 hypothetical protein FO442_11545 [Fluviicola chungangensis]